MKNKKLIFSLLLLIHIPLVFAIEKATDARLDEVAEKGRLVMPFNLEQTLHVFSKSEQGGVQQVIVKDESDKAQIALIQDHLDKIYNDFKNRDFSDPEKIHGADMPGLKALKNAAYDEITLQFRILANGAEIVYTAKSPVLIDAIHQWFDAQLSDHARHSTMHQLHHRMHKDQ